MLYYLNGVVSHIEPGVAVIDCGGVGFYCHTTANTLSYLTTGEKAKLFTFCNIREDAFDIFGFYTMSELRTFEMLVGVSGVGPKAALSILSANTPEALAAAVISNNEKALTSAPGVGKKLAQRVILELKDKMGKQSAELYGTASTPIQGGTLSKAGDASAALAVLGYSPAEINAALSGADMDAMTLEEIIRFALKNMLKQR